MENGPYLIQQLHNDSIGRKQEQSLLYLFVCECVCVCGREAGHSRVVAVVTVQEMTSACCEECDKRHNSLWSDSGVSERSETEGYRRSERSQTGSKASVRGVFRLAVSGSARALGLNEEVNGR